jgi:integrase
MARVILTDTYIRSPKRVPATGRAEYRDAWAPGLALRVSEFGHRSFVLVTRYPGHTHPTRRSRGEYGVITLEEARDMARDWLKLIKRGIDPKAEIAKERAANLRVKKFGDVLQDWLIRDMDQKANGKQTRQLFDREIPKAWLNRPIGDLRREDIATVCRAIVSRGHKAQAHVFYANLRRLFSWAIGTGEYGLELSPTTGLKPTDLIGEKVLRDRVLDDAELVAVWNAADQCGYAVGDIVKLLMLTGQRLNDIAQLSWPEPKKPGEVDLDKALITIPAARMKSKRAHEIPLAPMALSILKAIPHQRGKYVFSSTNGHRPFRGFSKAKDTIDKLSGVTGRVFHDLRRTFRTRIAPFAVSETVKELCIAHAIGGLHAVYDQHRYRLEKLDVFKRWERELSNLINPPAKTNVVSIPRRDMPAPKIARRPMSTQRAPQRLRTAE